MYKCVFLNGFGRPETRQVVGTKIFLVFFAEFDVKTGLICQRIWKGSTQVFLNEALRKLEKMSASSNHLTFPVKWVKSNCELVYLNPDIT